MEACEDNKTQYGETEECVISFSSKGDKCPGEEISGKKNFCLTGEMSQYLLVPGCIMFVVDTTSLNTLINIFSVVG
jgi:hypothetical protein